MEGKTHTTITVLKQKEYRKDVQRLSSGGTQHRPSYAKHTLARVSKEPADGANGNLHPSRQARPATLDLTSFSATTNITVANFQDDREGIRPG